MITFDLAVITKLLQPSMPQSPESKAITQLLWQVSGELRCSSPSYKMAELQNKYINH